jgi:membrane protease YdiL (CAAX protease family)
MQDEASARPMTPLLAAMWSFGLFVLEQVCVGATEAIRPGALTDVVNVCACSLLATSVVVFAMVRIHARDVSLRRTLGVVAPAPTHVFLAVAAGAGLFPLKTAIDARILAWRPYSQEETALLSKLTDVPTMHARVLLVVTFMVLMPIAGELFFRGVLFGELRRAAGATVAIASTTLFSMSFEDARAWPTALLLGLMLGVLRERTGTVVTAILAHLAFWSVEAIPLLRGADPDADPHFPPRWVVGGALIALLAVAGAGAGRKEPE